MRIGKLVVATEGDLRKMHDAAMGILETVGMRVTHRPALDRLEAYGGKVSRADCVVRMPSKVVQKAIAAMKKKRTPSRKSPDGGFAGKFSVSLGDGCFFFYDFDKKTRRKATRKDFIDAVRFADAVSEVTSFAAPVEIGDFPIKTMVLEMQALCYLNSEKPSSVESNIPEQIKHLAELHKVAGDYRQEASSWLGSAQGVTSPLTFGDRAFELYLEGGKHGFKSGVYTMPIAGMNAPVTVEGCATQAAAEILGAWTCLMAIDEDRIVGTLVLTGTTDMRTGKTCWSSPGAIRQNCLVSAMLEDVVGVSVNWDWTWYTDAIEPGYQCGIDRAMKILTLAPQSGSMGFHAGDLDGASVFSLEQAVLDLDICRAIWQLFKPCHFDEEMMAVGEIKDLGLSHGKTHLERPFTLQHFREAQFMPEIIPHPYWREDLQGVAESDVIKAAHERWKSIVAKHEPYQAPARMIRDIEKVLARAREELS